MGFVSNSEWSPWFPQSLNSSVMSEGLSVSSPCHVNPVSCTALDWCEVWFMWLLKLKHEKEQPVFYFLTFLCLNAENLLYTNLSSASGSGSAFSLCLGSESLHTSPGQPDLLFLPPALHSTDCPEVLEQKSFSINHSHQHLKCVVLLSDL